MLWMQRADAVGSPHFDVVALARLDMRLDAHLDGLRVAWPRDEMTITSMLDSEDVGGVFAAGSIAFGLGDRNMVTKLVRRAENAPEVTNALASALGWVGSDSKLDLLARFLASSNATEYYVAFAGSALVRDNLGRALIDGIDSLNTRLRYRALRFAGEIGRRDLAPRLVLALHSPDIRCRFAAAWSLLVLNGAAEAITTLCSFAESSFGALGEAAARSVVRRMNHSSATSWRTALSASPTSRRFGIIAAGQFGDPETIPWLIEQMQIPALARVAGEAFTFITGIGIDYRDLDGSKPDGFDSGPTEDPKDENVEMDPDENLPWPDPVKVAAWWDQHRGEFQNGTRYLCGKPISIEWCKTVLRDGFQRQRAAAALELAILQPGTPLFNVKAPGFRQIELLGKPQGPIR
jgi:uncharacterized protein (TIGR02270 family)